MKKSTVVILFVAGTILLGGHVVISNRELIIARLAEAIAYAEGFYVSGSVPARLHNPGDLTRDLTGTAIGQEGQYMVYQNDFDGWEALRHQVRMMFGGSKIYNAGMSILEMARKYTSTEQNEWAANVARRLGVPVTTKLVEIV